MPNEEAARVLSDWALANPRDAARLLALLLRNPGGACTVYLPALPSTEVRGQCSVASSFVD